MCNTCYSIRSEFRVPWDMHNLHKLLHVPVEGAPTPLHVACYRGRVSVVEELLSESSSAELARVIDARTTDQQTPLSYAVRRGHLMVVDRLLTAKADVMVVDVNESTLLHACALTKDDGTIARALLRSVSRGSGSRLVGSHGAMQLVERRDKGGMTAWHRACLHGNRAIMGLLLSECAQNPNEACKHGATAAHILAKAGRVELLEWLLDHHGLHHTPLVFGWEQPRHAGEGGNTPLHLAALGKRWEVARALVSRGASVHAQNNDLLPPMLTLGWDRDGSPSKLSNTMLQPRGVTEGAANWVMWKRTWNPTAISVKTEEKAPRMRNLSASRHREKSKERVLSAPGFTEDSIDKVIELMDPNGDGDIDLEELGASIRLFKRAAAMDKNDREAKLVMKKLTAHMEAHGLTTKLLFAKIDKSGDGTISGRELGAGLAEFAKSGDYDNKPFDLGFSEHLGIELDEAQMIMHLAGNGDAEAKEKLDEFRNKVDLSKKTTVLSNKEIDAIRCYMDPNGDGSIDIYELEAAFKRANKTAMQDSLEGEVIPIINTLEMYMNRRAMRLIDLFSEFDTDDSGSVSRDELREGLKRIASPPVRQSKAAKIRAERAKQVRSNLKSREAQKRAWLIDPTGWKKRAQSAAELAPVRSATPAGLSSKKGPLELGEYSKPWNWHLSAEAKEHRRRMTLDSYMPPRPKSTEPSRRCPICNGSTGNCAEYHSMLDQSNTLTATTTVTRKMTDVKLVGPFKQSVGWKNSL